MIGRWFPTAEILDDEARRHIALLYGGGEYTNSRKITHTLMHYKSFERLFLARCGTSIASKRIIAQLVASGGMALEDQAHNLAPFIFEANAMRQQAGQEERYEIKLMHQKGFAGDDGELELRVIETLHDNNNPDAPGRLVASDYSTNDFINMLRKLRAHRHAFGVAATHGSRLLEQWQLIAAADASGSLSELAEILFDSWEDIKEVWTTLVSFFQMIASLLVTFPTIKWPNLFSKITDAFKVFNFDFLNLDHLQATMQSSTNYCTNTLGMCYVLTIFLLCIYPSYKLILWKLKPPVHHVNVFFDRVVYLVTFCTFLSYPVLSLKLLPLFAPRSFGDERVLDADWTLEYDDIGWCQSQGAFFIVIYVLGIPYYYFRSLYAIKDSFREVDFSKDGADKLLSKEKRYLRRYGMIYAKYERRCWWWELTELARKLSISGLLIFISPRTVTQIWSSLLVCMLFLLLQTFFMPFEADLDDYVATTGQLCTMMTLLLVLAIKTNLAEEGILTDTVTSALMALFSIAPLLLTFYVVYDLVSSLRAERRRNSGANKSLPAALRDEEPQHASTDALHYKTAKEQEEMRDRKSSVRFVSAPFRLVSSSRVALRRLTSFGTGQSQTRSFSLDAAAETTNNLGAEGTTDAVPSHQGKASCTPPTALSEGSADSAPAHAPTSQPLGKGVMHRLHSMLKLSNGGGAQGSTLAEPSGSLEISKATKDLRPES